MRAALLLLALSLPAPGADALLDRARQAMEERLASTPNYTCVLEVDRMSYPPGPLGRYQSQELARVEISVVGGRELFAWPGDASPQEQLEPLLGPGLTSTGEFSAHGRATFLDARSSIERLPDELQDQPGRVGYAYRVPLESSRYVVAGGDLGSIAPYEGEFWIDADSGQLVRFDVRVPAPPEKSGVKRIDSYVLYESRDVSGRPAWLPSLAQITVQSATGRSFRNDLRYSSCRAFQAEATLRFDEKAFETTQTSGPVQDVVVPAGLELQMESRTAYDSAHTRAGDAFEATLRNDVKAGDLVVPKGATVRGRVRRLALMNIGASRGPGRSNRYVVTFTLELLEVSWPGHCGRISATLKEVGKIPDMAPVNPDGLRPPQAFFNSDRALGYRTSARMSAKGQGTFVVLGDLYTIPAGARLTWRTEAPPSEPCALR